MSRVKTYTAIVMIPQVLRVTEVNISKAEDAFVNKTNELVPDYSYTAYDTDDEKVVFEPNLIFIQEGDLTNEQTKKRA